MKTERNPENTRSRILFAAFQEMHKHGFQGMRVDQVLKKTDLKKGALYHHFSSKQALGYAVLEELIEKQITENWIDQLKKYDDPLTGLYELISGLDKTWSDEFFALGCPLNNLAQEMSPIDEGFRTRIEKFFQIWKNQLKFALELGQENGFVDKSINTDDAAIFILSTSEGIIGMTKNHQNKDIFYACCRELKRYLDTLRPTNF